jgi:hypothetical protein
MMRVKIGTVLVFVFGLTVTLSIAWAQSVPQLINYQGRLLDAVGTPLDSTVEMRFVFLDGDTSTATVLWGETHLSVQVNQGIYSVILGSMNPIPPSALGSSTVFMEVRVEGELQTPRMRRALRSKRWTGGRSRWN